MREFKKLHLRSSLYFGGPNLIFMEEKILHLLARSDYSPLDAAGLLARLKLAKPQAQELSQVLGRLERSGRIARIKKGACYALAVEADLIPGRIRMNRQGVGFMQPDDPRLPAIRIPQDATGTAMHGDKVLVRLDVSPRPGGRNSGEGSGRVIRVLEKARLQVVGTLQQGRQVLLVIPDDPRITQDILVPAPTDVGRPARAGDKVVVELKEWTHRNASPEGEIVEVLGPPGAEGVDMLSIIRNYDLSLHFPKVVLREAREIGTQVKPEDILGRMDCRSHDVITIDPFDAKDFDDAFCLQRADQDQWKLWVHIADVSHYVKPGTALDAEAAERGNSTYLVDRVIPMLPEALSNELCSLKPGVDRLTKCVEFILTPTGQVLRTQFYAAVIHSSRRFSYEEAFATLQRPPKDATETMLHQAHTLAQKVRRARFQAGSLDLDFPETKIRLREDGSIDRIEKVVNDFSHQLIEEFMLLANEAVATRLMSLNRPALYRIHEPPNEGRLTEFREEVLSHFIPCGNLTQKREVQKLLANLNELPIGPALKIGFLKSLMRARYSIEPLGHYGLAKAKYTHFTSPIRRYADLVVHRALFQKPGEPLGAKSLTEISDHISVTERTSDDAERDSRDVKLMAYLDSLCKSKSPQSFPALVTDVRNFGFFVDVPDLGMSGLVPLSGMGDDFYQFDGTQGRLVGRRTRHVIQLGDRLHVRPAKVDHFKKQVDYELAEMPGQKTRTPARGVPTQRPNLKPPQKPQPPRQTRPPGQPHSQPGRRPSGTAPAPAHNRRPNTAQRRPDAAQPRPNTAQPRPNTTQPRPNTTQPRPNTTQPRPNTTQPRPNTAQRRPDTAQPRPATTNPSRPPHVPKPPQAHTPRPQPNRQPQHPGKKPDRPKANRPPEGR